MKLIYPEFNPKTQDPSMIIFNFKTNYLNLFFDFFRPFEDTYEFKTSLKYVTR